MRFRKLISRLLCGLVVFSILTCFCHADPAEDELKALRKEVNELNKSQIAIRNELDEIRTLLRENLARAGQAAPSADSVGSRPRGRMDISLAPFKGDRKAKVTLIDIFDYRCDHCSDFFREIFPQIQRDYIDTGKIKFVAFDYFLPGVPDASKPAEAALCAGAQGKYWEMHARLFENQQALGDKELDAYAQVENLDFAKFHECLTSGKFRPQLNAHLILAKESGVNGTPTFLLGLTEPDSGSFSPSRVLLGKKPYSTFKEAIERLLQTSAQATSPQNLILHIDQAPSRGPKNAPLTLVEFSDYQCPFCANYVRNTLPEIFRDYVDKGKVRYIYCDFPLMMHPEAVKAAEAALCAGEQGKYWEMHARLFENQQALGDTEILGHARALGLDLARFQQSFESGKFQSIVRTNVAQGEQAAVAGTPTFFFGIAEANGSGINVLRELRGARAYWNFKETIDGLLASKSK